MFTEERRTVKEDTPRFELGLLALVALFSTVFAVFVGGGGGAGGGVGAATLGAFGMHIIMIVYFRFEFELDVLNS